MCDLQVPSLPPTRGGCPHERSPRPHLAAHITCQAAIGCVLTPARRCVPLVGAGEVNAHGESGHAVLHRLQLRGGPGQHERVVPRHGVPHLHRLRVRRARAAHGANRWRGHRLRRPELRRGARWRRAARLSGRVQVLAACRLKVQRTCSSLCRSSQGRPAPEQSTLCTTSVLVAKYVSMPGPGRLEFATVLAFLYF